MNSTRNDIRCDLNSRTSKKNSKHGPIIVMDIRIDPLDEETKQRGQFDQKGLQTLCSEDDSQI